LLLGLGERAIALSGLKAIAKRCKKAIAKRCKKAIAFKSYALVTSISKKVKNL
jgi:hypothetical protein